MTFTLIGEARNGNSGDDHRIQLSIEYKLVRWYCCIVRGHFALPLYIDLSATCLYAMTGALLAIRRHYDVVGLFVLALVSGVGGGLIRDGIFIQRGPPLAMSDGRYLFVVILGCIGAALFRNHMDRFQTVFLFADALGVGCYAVVGVEHALNAQLPILASIMIGVVTACGGGLLRDVLVRDEPLLFKPGQLYVLAALIGASLFTLLLLYFKISATGAALLGNWLLLYFSHPGHPVQLENRFRVSQVGLGSKADEGTETVSCILIRRNRSLAICLLPARQSRYRN